MTEPIHYIYAQKTLSGFGGIVPDFLYLYHFPTKQAATNHQSISKSMDREYGNKDHQYYSIVATTSDEYLKKFPSLMRNVESVEHIYPMGKITKSVKTTTMAGKRYAYWFEYKANGRTYYLDGWGRVTTDTSEIAFVYSQKAAKDIYTAYENHQTYGRNVADRTILPFKMQKVLEDRR